MENVMSISESLLHIQAKSGDLRKLGHTIGTVKDLDVKCPNTGNTALHEAIAAGKTKAAEMLIDAGADIFSKNHEGFSPWVFCHKYDNTEVFVMLCQSEHPLLEKEWLEENIQSGRASDAELMISCQ